MYVMLQMLRHFLFYRTEAQHHCRFLENDLARKRVRHRYAHKLEKGKQGYFKI